MEAKYIYVADGDKVLNPMTNSIEYTVRLPGVCEFLITQEYIYATDIRKDRVVKLNKSGTFFFYGPLVKKGSVQVSLTSLMAFDRARIIAYTCVIQIITGYKFLMKI